MESIVERPIQEQFKVSTTRKGLPSLQSKDGHKYTSEKKGNKKPQLMWWCSEQKKSGCKASFFTDLQITWYKNFKNIHLCDLKAEQEIIKQLTTEELKNSRLY